MRLALFRQGQGEEMICDTLYQCFFFTLTSGLRASGGIGDLLVTPSFTHEVSLYFWRLVFDLTFFIVVIVLVLNAGAWPCYCRMPPLLSPVSAFGVYDLSIPWSQKRLPSGNLLGLFR